jgi:hypothetical protein
LASSNHDARQSKQSLGLAAEYPVVAILTNSFGSGVFNGVDLLCYQRSWENLLSFVDHHPEIQFVIKPHPYLDRVDWYRHIAESSRCPHLKIIESVKLEHLLPAVDVVLLMQAVGTAGYLTLMAEKPLCLYLTDKRWKARTVAAWGQHNGLTVIDKDDMLPETLLRLLQDNEYRAESVRRGQAFLERSIHARDGRACERIVEAIRRLVDES